MPPNRAKVDYNHDSGCVNGAQVVLEFDIPQARLNPGPKDLVSMFMKTLVFSLTSTTDVMNSRVHSSERQNDIHRHTAK